MSDRGAPPRDVKPSELVAKLLTRGRPPFAVVPFPRRDENGDTICDVHIRLMSQEEEDSCFANAAMYVRDRLKGGRDLPWKPEDLEENARAAELLSVACRNPDDPERAFFERGVIETRLFNTDELAQLYLTYAKLKDQSYPGLREMTKEVVDAWIDIIAQGALDHPFGQFSRTKLETFCDLLVKRLVDQREESLTQTSSSGADS